MVRSATIARLLLPLVLTGCLAACATVPASSSGTSNSRFKTAAEVPRQVRIVSTGIPQYDPVGQVLGEDLPSLGISLSSDSAAATLNAEVRWSDFSPVHLSVELIEPESGNILWSAEVVHRWDIYASVVDASKSNAREAVRLLRRDLAKLAK